jgi:hypothetical protein
MDISLEREEYGEIVTSVFDLLVDGFPTICVQAVYLCKCIFDWYWTLYLKSRNINKHF